MLTEEKQTQLLAILVAQPTEQLLALRAIIDELIKDMGEVNERMDW